jgi:hypothetical protein
MRVSRILFLFAAMAAIGMGLVRLRTDTQQAGYRIGQLQAQERELSRQCLDLQLDVARLRSPSRLEDQVTKLALDLGPPGPLGPVAVSAQQALAATTPKPPKPHAAGGLIAARGLITHRTGR